MDVLDVGYRNRNRQINLGRLERRLPGPYWRLHCLDCGETYSSYQRVYDRTCPGCRGGTAGPREAAGEWPDTRDGRRVQAIEILADALSQ